MLIVSGCSCKLLKIELIFGPRYEWLPVSVAICQVSLVRALRYRMGFSNDGTVSNMAKASVPARTSRYDPIAHVKRGIRSTLLQSQFCVLRGRIPCESI